MLSSWSSRTPEVEVSTALSRSIDSSSPYITVKMEGNRSVLFWTSSGHASTLPFQILFKSNLGFLCNVTPRSLSCSLPHALDFGNFFFSGLGSFGFTIRAGLSLPPPLVVRVTASSRSSGIVNKNRTPRIVWVLIHQRGISRGGYSLGRGSCLCSGGVSGGVAGCWGMGGIAAGRGWESCCHAGWWGGWA